MTYLGARCFQYTINNLTERTQSSERKSTETLISHRSSTPKNSAYLGKWLRMLAIRSLPVSRLPINICAERCSTNSRLLAKNKTVTCLVKMNNYKPFAVFRVNSSTYANMLNVNKIILANANIRTCRYSYLQLKRFPIIYKKINRLLLGECDVDCGNRL